MKERKLYSQPPVTLTRGDSLRELLRARDLRLKAGGTYWSAKSFEVILGEPTAVPPLRLSADPRRGWSAGISWLARF